MASLKRCTSNGGFSVSIDITLEASRVPFVICGLAIVALIALLVIRATTNAKFLGGYVTETDSALVRFMLAGSLYIGLFVIALASAYIGYRMVVAAGATATVVIPPQDYALLADGKSESIDQYVRLSSLAKFTGTFTQLGTHWPTVGDDRTHPILRCVGANKAQRLPRSHETYARCVHRFICPASS